MSRFSSAPGLGDREARPVVLPPRPETRRERAIAEIDAAAFPGFQPSTEALIIVDAMVAAIASGAWDKRITSGHQRRKSAAIALAVEAAPTGL